jgi:hypothetical protein
MQIEGDLNIQRREKDMSLVLLIDQPDQTHSWVLRLAACGSPG